MISNQMVLEFGNGDIGVVGGTAKEDNTMGVVVFHNIKKREIGTREDISENEEFPVIMTFTNTNSIDVVIGELIKARTGMSKTETEG